MKQLLGSIIGVVALALAGLLVLRIWHSSVVVAHPAQLSGRQWRREFFGKGKKKVHSNLHNKIGIDYADNAAEYPSDLSPKFLIKPKAPVSKLLTGAFK